MKSTITRLTFKRKMRKVKNELLTGKNPYTCNIMCDYFGGNVDRSIYHAYMSIIRGILSENHNGVLSFYGAEFLSKDYAILRRYLILDAFEQEVLATWEFKNE